MDVQFLAGILLIFITLSSATNVLRPRGVSLQNSPLYDPGRPFVCFDGSAQIHFNRINDDYCDCVDGSDEPGTSACVNGTFYCTNVGHSPKEITSSLVNDGVCDCCDASDEWASDADCINNCEQLGAAARQEAELRHLEEMKGYTIRQQMAEQGQQMRNEKKVKLAQLEKESEEAEARRQEMLAAKELAEAPEKEALEKYKDVEEELKHKREEEKKIKEDALAREAFADLDSNNDGMLTVSEIQERSIFDTNKDGEITEDEAKFYLGLAESVDLDTFLASGWALIKPTYQYGRNMFTPPEPNTGAPPKIPESIADLPLEGQEEITQPEDIPFDEDPENFQDEDLDDEEYAEELEDEQINKEKEIADLEYKIEYDEETQKLIDAAQTARSHYEEQAKIAKDITDEINEIKASLEKDFGPNDEFRPLLDSCFELTDREYVYKICPFDYASQKPRDGHSETRLGSWGHWSGPQDSPYSAMKYTGGQQCWNGPQRSAEVQLHCATETALTAVSEPNRCEYLFIVSTPAVCIQPDKSNTLHKHIEL